MSNLKTDLSLKIAPVVAENPKRGKAAERFAFYSKRGSTVKTYIKKCVAAGHTRASALADIRYDLAKGLIAAA